MQHRNSAAASRPNNRPQENGEDAAGPTSPAPPPSKRTTPSRPRDRMVEGEEQRLPAARGGWMTPVSQWVDVSSNDAIVEDAKKGCSRDSQPAWPTLTSTQSGSAEHATAPLKARERSRCQMTRACEVRPRDAARVNAATPHAPTERGGTCGAHKVAGRRRRRRRHPHPHPPPLGRRAARRRGCRTRVSPATGGAPAAPAAAQSRRPPTRRRRG